MTSQLDGIPMYVKVAAYLATVPRHEIPRLIVSTKMVSYASRPCFGSGKIAFRFCVPCWFGEICEEHGSTHCECDGSAVAA